jgi:hypothetical protein
MSERLSVDLVNTPAFMPDRRGVAVDDGRRAKATVAAMVDELRQEDALEAPEVVRLVAERHGCRGMGSLLDRPRRRYPVTAVGFALCYRPACER